ncbi:MAG TPA: hypothetical protein VGJ05_11500 [Fimbriiglobus sp.]
MTALDGNSKPFILPAYVPQSFFLSADGTKVYFSGLRGEEVADEKYFGVTSWVLDLVSKKVAGLNLPVNHYLEAISSDGKTMISSTFTQEKEFYVRRTFLTDGNAEKPIEILKPGVSAFEVRFSPDGSQVLIHAVEYVNLKWNGGDFSASDITRNEAVLVNVVTRKESTVESLPVATIRAWSWSPDGKRIAYVVHDPNAKGGVPGKKEYSIFVAEPNGANAKLIYKAEGSDLEYFDWR